MTIRTGRGSEWGTELARLTQQHHHLEAMVAARRESEHELSCADRVWFENTTRRLSELSGELAALTVEVGALAGHAVTNQPG